MSDWVDFLTPRAGDEADQVANPERYPFHLVAIWAEGEKVQRGFVSREAGEAMLPKLADRNARLGWDLRYEIRENPEGKR